jgi:hypothetical protein
VSPRYRRLARVRDQETTALQGVRAGHDQRIEPTFATVRYRTKVTKGPGGRLAMAFKLIESAQDHWRAKTLPNLVALVRVGASFVDGKLTGRPASGGDRLNAPKPQQPLAAASTAPGRW